MMPGPGALLSAVEPGVRVHSRFEWAGLPEGVWALIALTVAAAVLFGVFVLYRRERAAAAPRLRWVCCGLRLLCLGALAMILLRPSVARDVERFVPGRLVILADRSASMSVRDAQLDAELASSWAEALGLPSGESVAELTRHDILRGVLQRGDSALLREGRLTNQVELMIFADDVRTLLQLARHESPEERAESGRDVPPLPEWTPTGAATDLSRALRTVLEGPESARLAAIVLLTDGRHTEGGEVAAAIAGALEMGVPLYSVGIGSPVSPRNVAVAELSSSDHAIRELPLEMRAFVRSTGYAGRTVLVVLTATDVTTGRSREVLRLPVVLAGDGTRQMVDLTHSPTAAGRLRYGAHIEPLEGESRSDDNRATREVLVTQEKMRVLLVAGGPSRGYRFLKALIDRDPAFELTVRLHEAAGGGVAALPGEPAELLEYDVVLLCDPSPDDLDPRWAEMLAGVVDSEGLGVAFVAGPTYTAEILSDPAFEALRDALPIVVDRAGTRALIGGARLFTESRPVELAETGRGHPITNPGAGVEPERFWSDVPGLYWVLPTERAKPGATVLLRCGDPAFAAGGVLAAVHSYGLGRVFHCGSPETWRWRKRGIRYYQKFWLQALRYCARSRLMGRDRRVRISLDRFAYGLGEPVAVRATLLDGELRPLNDERAELGIELNGRPAGTVELRRTEEAGVYEGLFYPEGFGRYELLYTKPDGTRVVEPLDVRPPDVEFEDVTMARRAMEELAARTGGRYFEPDELDRLPALVPDRGRTVVEEGPLTPLWDTPSLLALLVGALGAEWLLRKVMGML